jgi:hypothetical protein
MARPDPSLSYLIVKLFKSASFGFAAFAPLREIHYLKPHSTESRAFRIILSDRLNAGKAFRLLSKPIRES